MAHLVGLIDPRGSELRGLARTFEVTATGGEFGIPDLNNAKAWLVELGLAEEQDGYFRLAGALPDHESAGDPTLRLVILRSAIDRLLSVQAGIDGPALLEEIKSVAPEDPVFQSAALFAEERLDIVRRELIGEIGEEVVLSEVRTELLSLDSPDLADRARRVSLESDRFGFDVLAPRVGHPGDDLLEVKASTSIGEFVRFYLSRNESEVGQEEDAWKLVICRVTDVEVRSGEVVGWCTHADLSAMLPEDKGNARWELVQLQFRVSELRPGLP